MRIISFTGFNDNADPFYKSKRVLKFHDFIRRIDYHLVSPKTSYSLYYFKNEIKDFVFFTSIPPNMV